MIYITKRFTPKRLSFVCFTQRNFTLLGGFYRSLEFFLRNGSIVVELISTYKCFLESVVAKNRQTDIKQKMSVEET